jgi:hypothetical protein
MAAPTGLSPEKLIIYNKFLEEFGENSANQYALGQGATLPPPAVGAPTLGEMGLVVQPPPPRQPIGLVPPSVVLPEVREQATARPSVPAMKLSIDQLADRAIQVQTALKQRQGLSYDAARAEAEAEVGKIKGAARTVDYSPKPVPTGYSEIAVRGEELLPRMSAPVALLQSFKPQVLETEQEAAGRRRFAAAQRDSKAALERDRALSGRTLGQEVAFKTLNNDLAALDIARQMGDTSVKNLEQIRASLNAPLYAAVEELRGRPATESIAGAAGDALRGLSQEERGGRLVETKGAAALRGLGGLTRLGTEAIRIPVEALATRAAAAVEGVPVETLLEPEGGMRRVQVPGVTYEPGFEARQRLQTGSYFKDVASQIATGRSAIDDFVDTGVGVRAATVLGLVTEFGLPLTPLGYITDVAPAFGLGKIVSRAADAGGAVARAPKLKTFLTETAASVADLGIAMEKPSWWKAISDAADLRTASATKLADELGDVAALDTLVMKASKKGANEGEEFLLTDAFKEERSKAIDGLKDIIQGVRSGKYSRSQVVKDIVESIGDVEINNIEEILLRLNRKADGATPVGALRGVMQKIGKVSTGTPGDISPDIVRNTFAAAKRSPAEFGEVNEAALRSATAEILERVPESGWIFVTPQIAVRKSVVATDSFQKAMSKAVRALPPGASVADVSDAVNNAIRTGFKGTAEPVAFVAPRQPGLLPSGPRGGLERIAEPSSRAFPVIEAAQDVFDNVRIVKNFLLEKVGRPPALRVSDTFSGSSFINNTDKMLDSVATQRIPVQLRDFIEATKSEISALGVVRQRILGTDGTLIEAIRVAGGLEEYLNLRIAADSGGIPKLKAKDVVLGSLPGNVPPLKNTPGAPGALNSIVKNFFGEGAITGPLATREAELALDRIIAASIARNDSATPAIAEIISEMRSEFPTLVKAGRRTAGRLTDDVSSAIVDHILKSEAKVIFADNFAAAYPELFSAGSIVDALPARFEAEIELGNRQPGLEPPPAAARAQALEIIKEFTADQVTALENVILNAVKKSFTDGVLDYSNSFTKYELYDQLKLEDIFKELVEIDNTLPEAQRFAFDAAFNALGESGDFESAVDAAIQFATLNRLVRPVQTADVMQFFTDTLRLPIDSSQRAVIESLIGNPDELQKGSGAIADNLSAIYRSPQGGLGESFTNAIASLYRFTNGLARAGLTTGVALPNIKFFAANYLGAPLIMGLTAPGLALKTTMSEVPGLGRLLGANTNIRDIKAWAAGPDAGSVAFTSAAGIPYTYRQLQAFLDNNYFGMTQQAFDFGSNFAGDVKTATRTGASGMKAKSLEARTGRVLDWLNVGGTNYWTAWGGQVDTAWRQQLFVNALQAGETPVAARAIASNGVLDYGRIPAEWRQSSTRWMTFFSFMAVMNAEIFSALFRPQAVESIARQVGAQRTLHRGFGEWQYEDDDFKKRTFSAMMGETDDKPLFFVGPENPLISPFIDQVTLASAVEHIMTSPPVSMSEGMTTATDVATGFAQTLVDRSFTPFLGFLSDLGLFGERIGIGNNISARQIAFHQTLDSFYPGHFAQWMSDYDITAVPVDERRPGEPLFNGQQYRFSDNKGKAKAAVRDWGLTMVGLQRAIRDYESMGLIATGGPQGTQMKKFDGKFTALLTYFTGGNLVVGTPEYEAVRKALEAAERDLRDLGKKIE